MSDLETSVTVTPRGLLTLAGDPVLGREDWRIVQRPGETFSPEQLAEMVAQNGIEIGPFFDLVIAARKRLGLDVEKIEEPTRRGVMSSILDDLFGRARL